MAGKGRLTAKNSRLSLLCQKNSNNNQLMGGDVRGAAEEQQGVTVVTLYALLFILAGQRRHVALDCHTALQSQKQQ